MPPVRNAAATRERLLGCARNRFLNESYDNVGLRDIAGDAGVDVALVGRYFGSKEQLFKEVLRKDSGDWLAAAIQTGDLAAFLASSAARKDRDTDHIERLLIMLRSASCPQASAIVRSSFKADVLEPLANVLSGPQAEIRAAMALSFLLGTTILQTIMNLDTLHECEESVCHARFAGVLSAALEADVGVIPIPSCGSTNSARAQLNTGSRHPPSRSGHSPDADS